MAVRMPDARAGGSVSVARMLPLCHRSDRASSFVRAIDLTRDHSLLVGELVLTIRNGEY